MIIAPLAHAQIISLREGRGLFMRDPQIPRLIALPRATHIIIYLRALFYYSALLLFSTLDYGHYFGILALVCCYI